MTSPPAPVPPIPNAVQTAEPNSTTSGGSFLDRVSRKLSSFASQSLAKHEKLFSKTLTQHQHHSSHANNSADTTRTKAPKHGEKKTKKYILHDAAPTLRRSWSDKDHPQLLRAVRGSPAIERLNEANRYKNNVISVRSRNFSDLVTRFRADLLLDGECGEGEDDPNSWTTSLRTVTSQEHVTCEPEVA